MEEDWLANEELSGRESQPAAATTDTRTATATEGTVEEEEEEVSESAATTATRSAAASPGPDAGEEDSQVLALARKQPSANITQEQERSLLFAGLRRELDSLSSFAEIQDFSVAKQNGIDMYPLKLIDAIRSYVVDEDSVLWLPDELSSVTPIRIYGDGNCLGRCASVMAYGSQDWYDEMRIRITMELAANLEDYLKNDFLQAGISSESRGCRDHLLTQYALYSEFYLGQSLSKNNIREILQAETKAIAQYSVYVGMWKMHALSNILQAQIFSIYPTFAGAVVQKHLHRWVVPFPRQSPMTTATNNAVRSPYGIMWTSTLGPKQTQRQWRMNLFVVCVL